MTEMTEIDKKKVIGFQASKEEIIAISDLAMENERTRSAELRLAMRFWCERHGHTITLPQKAGLY